MQQQNAITVATPPIPSIGEVEALKEICKVAAYSGFLKSSAPRDNMTWRIADAFFVVMYGRELGIPAMTALKMIFVVDGKPSCSGEALLGMIRRAGVDILVPDPKEVRELEYAAIKVRRDPAGEYRTYTFTKQMAVEAGLWGSKDTWKKYSYQMLIWRAVSLVSKYECSDITGGMRTVEELAPEGAFDEDGAPVGDIIAPTGRIAIEREPEPPAGVLPEAAQDAVQPAAVPTQAQPPSDAQSGVSGAPQGTVAPNGSATPNGSASPDEATKRGASPDAFDRAFPPLSQMPVAETEGDDQHLPRTHAGIPILGSLNMVMLLQKATNDKLVKGKDHFANLIDLLWRDGLIRAASKPEAVLEAIRKHEAEKDMQKEGVGAR